MKANVCDWLVDNLLKYSTPFIQTFLQEKRERTDCQTEVFHENFNVPWCDVFTTTTTIFRKKKPSDDTVWQCLKILAL